MNQWIRTTEEEGAITRSAGSVDGLSALRGTRLPATTNGIYTLAEALDEFTKFFDARSDISQAHRDGTKTPFQRLHDVQRQMYEALRPLLFRRPSQDLLPIGRAETSAA